MALIAVPARPGNIGCHLSTANVSEWNSHFIDCSTVIGRQAPLLGTTSSDFNMFHHLKDICRPPVRRHSSYRRSPSLRRSCNGSAKRWPHLHNRPIDTDALSNIRLLLTRNHIAVVAGCTRSAQTREPSCGRSGAVNHVNGSTVSTMRKSMWLECDIFCPEMMYVVEM